MSLSEATLANDVRSRLFAPSPETRRTIGAELELIPIFSRTRLPPPIDSPTGPSLCAALRRAAKSGGWKELPSDSGTPSWSLPDGGRVSFEPGAQIEISSRPYESCSALITSLQATAATISAAAALDDIELLSVGADPHNDIAAVPLQLGSDRYVRMTRYLEARGESGARMMRQSAALHINVEHGARPFERWALLNALAPYVIAIFANSSRYSGRDTGHASYRSHFWRHLDDSRTGIPFDSRDPAGGYGEFALGAGAMRAERGTGEFHSFRSLLADQTLTADDWLFHLSTLFPEIRPKEYFEVRSADTISPEHLAAPLAFIAGLVYDQRATIDSLALIGAPDERLLARAGKEGLTNEKIKARAAELVRIAIEGASRLPDEYLAPEHRSLAAGWLTRRVS